MSGSPAADDPIGRASRLSAAQIAELAKATRSSPLSRPMSGSGSATPAELSNEGDPRTSVCRHPVPIFTLGPLGIKGAPYDGSYRPGSASIADPEKRSGGLAHQSEGAHNSVRESKRR